MQTDLLALNIVGAVLLAMAVYLMLHWEHVRRKSFFLIGLGGLGVMFCGNLFLVADTYLLFMVRLFYSVGLLAGVLGVLAGVYPGRLPVVEPAAAGPQPAPQVTPVTQVGKPESE